MSYEGEMVSAGADIQEPQTKWIKCIEPGCTEEFEFACGEQKFYADKGYPDPKRCKPHRIVQRERVQVRKTAEDYKIRRESSPFAEKNWKREKKGDY